MTSMISYTWLIPLLPLLGFLVNGLGRKKLSRSMTGIIGSGVVLGSFIISLMIFFEVSAENFQAQTIHLFDFIIYWQLQYSILLFKLISFLRYFY